MLREDPRWVLGVMASWKAEDIKAKFSTDRHSKLTVEETRYWSRLHRVYDGDPDALERPDLDDDGRTAEEREEDEVLAQLAAQLAAQAQAVEIPAEAEGATAC